MPLARALAVLPVAALAACAAPGPDIESLPARGLDRCAAAGAPEAFAGLDVAIAILTATSTARPSGVDVDGDGIVGVFRNGHTSDRGDSLLAAQVAAVKSLVRSGALRPARVAVLSYAGGIESTRPRSVSRVPRRDARALVPPTPAPAAIEAGLARVLARGSGGAVDLTAAVVLAVRTLRAADAAGDRDRAILLLSNSPTPILGAPTHLNYRTFEGENPNGPFLRFDPNLVVAVKRAIRAGATIHSFGLGRAAREQVPHVLSRVAGATGGTYHAVLDPTSLDCAMLRALAQR